MRLQERSARPWPVQRMKSAGRALLRERGEEGRVRAEVWIGSVDGLRMRAARLCSEIGEPGTGGKEGRSMKGEERLGTARRAPGIIT